MQIVEKIKEHPYLSALVVFVIGFALVLLFRSGSSSAPAQSGGVPDYGSMVGNGTAIQQAQIAADAQAQQTQAQLTAQDNLNSTNLAIAQLAQTVQLNGQNAQADTINKQTAAGVQVAQYQYDSTNFANQLVAQVQTHNIDAQTTTTLANITAQSDATRLASNVELAQLGYQHDISAQQIASQNLTTTLNAQVQEATLATSLQQTQLVANAYSTAAQYNSASSIAAINAAATTAQHQADLTYSQQLAAINASNYQAGLQAQAIAQAQGAAWIAAHT